MRKSDLSQRTSDGAYPMNEVVIDAGPIIHLSQLKLFHLFDLFPQLHTTPEAWREITRFNLPGKQEAESSRKIKITRISKKEKEKVMVAIRNFRLQSADFSLLALCNKLVAHAILTDDLELRRAAEGLGLETHGSLGIILRAYKKKWLSYRETQEALNNLFNLSTLYLSSKLLNRVLAELFKGK